MKKSIIILLTLLACTIVTARQIPVTNAYQLTEALTKASDWDTLRIYRTIQSLNLVQGRIGYQVDFCGASTMP